MAERRRLAAWLLWGVGPALYGLGTLAVILGQPFPNQHTVVGIALVLCPAMAALGTWSTGLWRAEVAALAFALSVGTLLVGSWLQGVLGAVGLYGSGHDAAPVLLAAALQAALLAGILRSRWPVWLAPLVLLGLYGWGSLRWPRGDDVWVVAGSILSYLTWVCFAAAGCLDAWTARSSASSPTSTTTPSA